MAKQNTADLFEESSRGAVGAVTAFVFLLSMILTVGGFILTSYGVNSALGEGEMLVFAGGIVSSVIGFMLPFAVLPAIGK